MATFDRTYFHPVYLDLYWRLIAERQRVWLRRFEGLAPPWSLDPILQNEFITNMYRELDPGTDYLMHNILAVEADPVDKLFNVCIYRLMGSRESSHEAIGFQTLAGYNSKRVKKAWEAMDDSPFGEAYRTASYTDLGGDDKLSNVVILFKNLKTLLPDVWDQIREATELRQVYELLLNLRGFGEFLAYQIMVDLLYPAPDEPLIPFSQDDWAMPGPGARKGIWRLMKPGMKPTNLLDVMRWLRDNQAGEFERLGIEMIYMKDSEGEDVPLSLCNIQSTLCEFFKYTRIWDGTLKQARPYKYSQGRDGTLSEPPLTFVRPSNLDEPLADEGTKTIEDPDNATLVPADTGEPFLPVMGELDVREIPMGDEAVSHLIRLEVTCSRQIRVLHVEF